MWESVTKIAVSLLLILIGNWHRHEEKKIFNNIKKQ